MSIKRLPQFILLLTGVLWLSPSAPASMVEVKKSSTGWNLSVDGMPYFVKGVCYTPTKVGEDPSAANWRDWMIVDDDKDGRIDAPYQAWLDENRNNKRDKHEKEVGDFALLKQMGANTIRVYHHASNDPNIMALHENNASTALMYNHSPNKNLLRDLYESYGIRVAMGDLLGAYTTATSASWEEGTDYTDPDQRSALLKSVEAMVQEHKDEPYLLMWILGNENVYPELTRTNANEHPQAWATLVNDAAQLIHRLDPRHPVALANGDVRSLSSYAKYAPDLDIFGANVYRGRGFGTFWKTVARHWDKPVLLTEYGSTFAKFNKKNQLDEDKQAEDIKACWLDIENHRAGRKAPHSAIGGFVYEWVDQWWLYQDPFAHNIIPNNPPLNAEWHGIASQGDGSRSPTLRQLRKVYFVYKNLWVEKVRESRK